MALPELIPLADPAVALRKESVDRNRDAGDRATAQAGRSPQGERG